MTGLEDFFGPNAGYVADLYESYRQDPASVDPQTRAIFSEWQSSTAIAPPSTATLAPGPDALDVTAAAAAAALAQAIRTFGHLAAHIDPLGSPRPGDPQLDPATHGVGEEQLERLPGSAVGGAVGRTAPNAAAAIRRLRELYCGSSGYELAHVQVPEERAWLIEAIEEGRFSPPNDPVDEHRLL